MNICTVMVNILKKIQLGAYLAPKYTKDEIKNMSAEEKEENKLVKI